MIKSLFYLLLLVTITGCNNQNIVHDEQTPEPEQIETEIAPEPIDTTALEDEAKFAYSEQNWDIAEIKYNQLIELEPEKTDYWFHLGNIYASTSRVESAIHSYRQAIIRDSKNIKAWNNMGISQLRQATITFLNMQDQLDKDDPLNARIDLIVNKISGLMENE
ncbi:MAG TPA: hypothetical protein EYQ42_09445 [Thiotrichaceae bacterium]|jgi:tetratricopeptide (TPR) repeat protein|nr:hypothetical protein [Thiotrichaceae bacterium]HIM09001.1 hypothetical protein [Gammaproteobacteria bacterium]